MTSFPFGVCQPLVADTAARPGARTLRPHDQLMLHSWLIMAYAHRDRHKRVKTIQFIKPKPPSVIRLAQAAPSQPWLGINHRFKPKFPTAATIWVADRYRCSPAPVNTLPVMPWICETQVSGITSAKQIRSQRILVQRAAESAEPTQTSQLLPQRSPARND